MEKKGLENFFSKIQYILFPTEKDFRIEVVSGSDPLVEEILFGTNEPLLEKINKGTIVIENADF